MNRWIKFGGIAALIFLVFALVESVLLTSLLGVGGALESFFVLGNLFLGVVLLALWFWFAGLKNIGAVGQAAIGRTARFGYNASAYLVVFVGILVAINWLASRYDSRWDFTEQSVYSLSPQSRDVLAGLKKPLRLVGLKGQSVARLGREGQDIGRATKELFELYLHSNHSMLSVEQFDPQAKPGLVEKYGFKGGNLLYLEYGEGDTKAVSRIDQVSEEAVTNAILKLQRGAAKKVYYLTGHDEPSLSSVGPEGVGLLKEAIANEHFTIEELFLAQSGAVPADAAAVMLVAPARTFGSGEKDALIKYVEAGGHLLLLPQRKMTVSDPVFDEVRSLANHFGIEIGDNLVLDRVARLFAAPEIGAQPVVRTYGSHPITKDFTPTTVTVFNAAASVRSKAKSMDGVTYTDLLKSSQTAWAETNLSALFADEPSADADDSDIKGPVSMGVVYEKRLKSEPEAAGKSAEDSATKSSRVVVIADGDWVLNSNLNVYANKDLVLNSINWIAGEEGGVSIRPRSLRESAAPIEQETFLRLITASFMIPELILMFGLVVWWRRRNNPSRAG